VQTDANLLASAQVKADQALYLDLLKRCLTGFLYPESSSQEIRPDPKMGFVKRHVFKALYKRGYKVIQPKPFDPEARELGKDWPSIGYSMIGLKRLDNLQYCVETVLDRNIPGDLLEAGVWRGGSCIFMRAILKLRAETGRTVWLADSFQGLPKPSNKADLEYDLSEIPILAVSQDEVEAAFRRFDLLDDQVKFLKGWFKDTLTQAPISEIAVLRLDGDLYESTMDVLNPLYEKVSAGGFVIVDDYHAFPCCEQAVREFRQRHDINDPIHEIDGTGVFWRKSS
jgi:O-methyltransferase